MMRIRISERKAMTIYCCIEKHTSLQVLRSCSATEESISAPAAEAEICAITTTTTTTTSGFDTRVAA